jgi:hypothetical protein
MYEYKLVYDCSDGIDDGIEMTCSVSALRYNVSSLLREFDRQDGRF